MKDALVSLLLVWCLCAACIGFDRLEKLGPFRPFCEAVVVHIEQTDDRHWGMDRTRFEFDLLHQAFVNGEDAEAIRTHAVRLTAAAYRQAHDAARSEAGARGERR